MKKILFLAFSILTVFAIFPKTGNAIIGSDTLTSGVLRDPTADLEHMRDNTNYASISVPFAAAGTACWNDSEVAEFDAILSTWITATGIN